MHESINYVLYVITFSTLAYGVEVKYVCVCGEGGCVYASLYEGRVHARVG